MRFIDSNIIAYAAYNNEQQNHCQDLLQNENNVTNTMALVEAFNIIEYQVSREAALIAIKSLLRSSTVIVNIDVNIIFEALKRSLQYKRLKFLDLVHYTTALLHHCDTMISYDHDFDNLEIPREE